jgi:hypothetical protein
MPRHYVRLVDQLALHRCSGDDIRFPHLLISSCPVVIVVTHLKQPCREPGTDTAGLLGAVSVVVLLNL